MAKTAALDRRCAVGACPVGVDAAAGEREQVPRQDRRVDEQKPGPAGAPGQRVAAPAADAGLHLAEFRGQRGSGVWGGADHSRQHGGGHPPGEFAVASSSGVLAVALCRAERESGAGRGGTLESLRRAAERVACAERADRPAQGRAEATLSLHRSNRGAGQHQARCGEAAVLADRCRFRALVTLATAVARPPGRPSRAHRHVHHGSGTGADRRRVAPCSHRRRRSSGFPGKLA